MKKIKKLEKEKKEHDTSINDLQKSLLEVQKSFEQQLKNKDEIIESKKDENQKLKNEKKILGSIREDYDEVKLINKQHKDTILYMDKLIKSYDLFIDNQKYDNRHPKWKQKHSQNLYELRSVVTDKPGIEKLIKKLGWKLDRDKNHKVYKRGSQTFICPSTPTEWITSFYNLRKLEQERIESEI